MLQIVVAASMALFTLNLYTKLMPYEKPEIGALQNFSQLMTFTQLFAAILIRAKIFQRFLPESLITGFLFVQNIAVFISATFSGMGPLIYGAYGVIIACVARQYKKFRNKFRDADDITESEDSDDEVQVEAYCGDCGKVHAEGECISTLTEVLRALERTSETRSVPEEDRELFLHFILERSVAIQRPSHAPPAVVDLHLRY